MDLDVGEMEFIFCDKHPHEPGLEVIKFEFILRLKIKRNDWLLADTCPQAANHCALFESETILKFYNLEARTQLSDPGSYGPLDGLVGQYWTDLGFTHYNGRLW